MNINKVLGNILYKIENWVIICAQEIHISSH